MSSSDSNTPRSALRDVFVIKRRPSGSNIKSMVLEPRAYPFSWEIPRSQRSNEEVPPTFCSSDPQCAPFEVIYQVSAVWESSDITENPSLYVRSQIQDPLLTCVLVWRSPSSYTRTRTFILWMACQMRTRAHGLKCPSSPTGQCLFDARSVISMIQRPPFTDVGSGHLADICNILSRFLYPILCRFHHNSTVLGPCAGDCFRCHHLHLCLQPSDHHGARRPAYHSSADTKRRVF